MKIDEGLDTALFGLFRYAVEITDTAGSLGGQLADLAANLATELIPRYLHGEIIPQPQSISASPVTKRLTKETVESTGQNRPQNELFIPDEPVAKRGPKLMGTLYYSPSSFE